MFVQRKEVQGIKLFIECVPIHTFEKFKQYCNFFHSLFFVLTLGTISNIYVCS